MGRLVPALEEARSTGARFYFTGKLCKHGHIAPRRTANRMCSVCGRQIDKKSYRKNRLKRIEKTKRWQRENPEAFAAYEAAYSREKRVANSMKWQRANRAHVNAYRRRLCEEDVGFKIRINLSNRLNQAAKSRGSVKSARTVELLGCSVLDLCAHLERQFLPGMTWENYGYGRNKWHVDHIKPCALFDLSDPAQQRECFNFANLRPLWQPENFRKGNRYA